MRIFVKCLAVLGLVASSLGWSLSASAEQKEVLGNWDVHYIAFPSTMLTPQIAQANGIVRSKYNSVVNISVLDSATKQAQDVSVVGTATNLLGTKKPLSFKKVVEGEAIYYLATLKFANLETYRFAIDVQNGNETQTLNFQQKMYAE